MTGVPPPRTSTGDAPGSSSVQVMLARLEAKLDVAIAQHGAKLENHDTELRDHETRLRVVEAKPTVSPKALWASLGSGVAVLAAVSPLLERLYSLHP